MGLARNIEALHENALDVLLEASQLFGASLDTSETINAILKLLSEKLQLGRGRVIFPDHQSGELRIRFAEGMTKIERERVSYAIGEGVTGQVMVTGQIALIPDVSKEPMYLGRTTNLKSLQGKTLAYIAVPILQENQPIGVLAVEAGRPIDPDFRQELRVLQILAAMIGQLSRIYGLVQKRTQQILAEHKAEEGEHDKVGMVYGILGESQELSDSVNSALKAAASDATVLLQGESGTGKERFARMIHLASHRRDQPFVCINCAAIPANLLEAELFGHEKGSFTGAIASRAGKLELAASGTLFLDEIGDMSLDLQVKLLRVLQEKVVQRVGGQKEIPVDTRIIAATNQRLKEAVNRGDFRMDLYYRLNVIRIKLPPLRARRDDIRLLTSYFLIRENQRHNHNLVLENDALTAMENYDWPGNVRQLENVIARLVIMADNQSISAADIEPILAEESQISVETNVVEEIPSITNINRPYERVRENDRHTITRALDQARGNKTAAARSLGLTPRQLYYRLQKLDIPLS